MGPKFKINFILNINKIFSRKKLLNVLHLHTRTYKLIDVFVLRRNRKTKFGRIYFKIENKLLKKYFKFQLGQDIPITIEHELNSQGKVNLQLLMYSIF